MGRARMHAIRGASMSNENRDLAASSVHIGESYQFPPLLFDTQMAREPNRHREIVCLRRLGCLCLRNETPGSQAVNGLLSLRFLCKQNMYSGTREPDNEKLHVNVQTHPCLELYFLNIPAMHFFTSG